jgi:hypothetical protein
MGLFDNKLGVGLAVGVGALIFSSAIIPAIGAILRPIAISSIKYGIILVEKATQLFAEAKETVEDMTAEAQAELAGEHSEVTTDPPENGGL